MVSRGTSVRIRFGSPFSSKVVVCGHCLVTLFLTINETLKWFSSLPILMQESFWLWQCSDRYIIISLFSHLHTPFPHFSPSLISLTISVDVKHHVYLLAAVCGRSHVTLSLAVDETLKWLSSLPSLMQKSFWWWQCSDRHTLSFPDVHTPFSHSPRPW